MTFQALLVSPDNEVAVVLTPVLASFGLGLKRCGYAEAVCELTQAKFDAVLVDFDDAPRAILVLQNVYLASPRNSTVTVALLRDKTKVRNVFGAGANFVLYKPVSTEQAEASLRAATTLIKRERRRSSRVPVQVSVELRLESGLEMEGILLDLSEDGMEVLAAQPLCPSATLDLKFNLPEEKTAIQARSEVAWASPNGQAGLRFVDLSENVRAGLRDWVARNTRKHPPEEPEPALRCKLTDLSFGGCYVETESPFPERTGVILRMKAGSLEVQANGMVRVMHPEFGMGIELAARTAGQQEKLANFIRFLLASLPEASPELVLTPRSLATVIDPATPERRGLEEFEDPLLDLLRSHEPISQEEFLRKLHQQRGSVEAARV